MTPQIEQTPKPTTETKTCEKHGQYVSTWQQIGRQNGFWSHCTECERERQLEHEQCQRDEAQRMQRARIDRLLRNAQIPPRFAHKGFDDFIVRTGAQKESLQAARGYAATFERNLSEGRCAVFIGSVGTGKTHLAIAILKDIIASGHSGRYATTADLVREIRDTWRPEARLSESEVLEDLSEVDLLIVDEVGLSLGGEKEQIQLSDLTDARYRKMRPTIVITNLDRAGLEAAIGERSVDRLREGGGVVIVFSGESYRNRVNQLQENVESPGMLQ
jgi:DNA replication protein DnaC